MPGNELKPNTPITQENVGLLKAGDRVKVSYYDTLWDGIGTVVDVNTKWRSSVGVERKDVGTGNFTPDCITFVSRPSTTTPALGDSVACPDCGKPCAPGSVHACPYRGSVSVPLDRPALAKPAEGEVCICPDPGARRERICRKCHPTPAAFLDVSRATNATPTPPSVDWSVVGPKLVEALEDCRLMSRQPEVQAIARAALAAAQPEGK